VIKKRAIILILCVFHEQATKIYKKIRQKKAQYPPPPGGVGVYEKNAKHIQTEVYVFWSDFLYVAEHTTHVISFSNHNMLCIFVFKTSGK